MHPDWITESHEIWLRGDDVDLDVVRLPSLWHTSTQHRCRALQDIDSLSSLA